MHRFIPFALLLTACSTSEEAYQERAIEALCERQIACLDAETLEAQGYNDQAGCVSTLTAEVPLSTELQDCEYDASFASDCIATLEGITCEDLESSVDTSPYSCDGVYVGECVEGEIDTE